MNPKDSPEMNGRTQDLPRKSPSPPLEGLDERELMARALEPETRPDTAPKHWEPPSPEALAGRLPDFEILRLIGRGGMGAVYEARQKRLDRRVALKVLPAEVAHSPEFAERFAREARLLARLNHPHIVAIHDFGSSGDLFYLVMELVDGVNLRQAIRSRSLRPEEALRIVPQICEALQFAHAQGVLHRDIKPENILLDREGRVKIADFGIAKMIDPGSPAHTLTATDRLLGTITYMAPEQVEGSRSVDHRADIYSLGVVFYEMLTGELPLGRFPKPSQRVEIDLRLDEVVLRTLEKEPALRYQQAGEIKSDVEHITQGPGGAAPGRPPAPSTAQLAAAVPSAAVTPPVNPPSDLALCAAACATPAPPPPRFSRKAIVGAVWGVLGFVFALGAVLPWVSIRSPSLVEADSALPSTVPSLIGIPFLILMALIGLSAPLGATILGMIAINDIRHSQGRLTGLPLALFASLLYPLILLDIVIIALWSLGLRWIVAMVGRDFVVVPAVWYMFPAALICLVADILIVIWAWRALRVPAPQARVPMPL